MQSSCCIARTGQVLTPSFPIMKILFCCLLIISCGKTLGQFISIDNKYFPGSNLIFLQVIFTLCACIYLIMKLLFCLFIFASRPIVLNGGQLCLQSLGDICQCLETFLVITIERRMQPALSG